MEDITRISEILSAVGWYFELKNLSLKNALSLRTPLSVENQKDLRQYYSQYFVGLLAATEILLEKEYSQRADFEEFIYNALSFEGYSDGKNNYSYIKELRNCIVHRGLDISSGAHIANDFPMIVSPQRITNRSGTSSYDSFGYYLIQVIDKCESVIGNAFQKHFYKFNFFSAVISQDEAIEQHKEYIIKSNVMPEWVKNMAFQVIKNGNIDYEEIYAANIKKLKKILEENIISQCIGNINSKELDLIKILSLKNIPNN